MTFSPVKHGRGDDPAAHLVDQVEHLLVVGPGAFLDAVALSALGVEPPDWSSAAMKPLPAAILAVISAVLHVSSVMRSDSMSETARCIRIELEDSLGAGERLHARQLAALPSIRGRRRRRSRHR